MAGVRRIVVVVPAHDEAELIGETLMGIPDFVYRIVVVDDGSRDGTDAVVRTCARPCELLKHETKLGAGAAIATGCRRAQALGADIVVVMAGDGQMDPSDLPALLAPLLADNADYVKGNRLDRPNARGAMPRSRWVGNHVLSLLTGFALGRRVRDSQCGYVAMNRRALCAVRWDALWHGYGYPNDLLSRLSLAGVRIGEVPVRPIYGAEQSGIGLRHALLVIPFVIARAWLRRWVSGAIEAPWRTSTSSTGMPTASARSPSSAMPTRDEAR